MSEVFEAEDVALERDVAVKILKAGAAISDRRLRRESTVLARLDHPVLVPVFDVGSHDGRPFLVMARVEGRPLDRVLAEDGPMSPAVVTDLARAVADGLAHAHTAGIVHRDVKPANVLVTPDGTPRLVDFGIALDQDAESLTREHAALGTVAYMAPEQLTGDTVTGKADVYALGLVLLECLTGRRAFPGVDAGSAAVRLARGPEIPPDLAPPWPSLLGRMTARDPDGRPPAEEVAPALPAGHGADALTRPFAAAPGPTDTAVLPTAAAPGPGTLAPAVRAAPPSGPPERRRVGRLGLVVVLAAALLAGLAFGLSRSDGGDEGAEQPARSSIPGLDPAVDDAFRQLREELQP